MPGYMVLFNAGKGVTDARILRDEGLELVALPFTGVYTKLICRGVLGSIAWLATPAWRKTMASANIRECLGVTEERAREIAEASVRRFGRMLVEVLRFPKLTPRTSGKPSKLRAKNTWTPPINKAKALLSAPLTTVTGKCWGQHSALMGYPLLSIARKQNNPSMDKFINEYREMVGQKIVYNRVRTVCSPLTGSLRIRKC